MDDVEKGKELVSAMTIIRSISRYVIYFMAIILILTIALVVVSCQKRAFSK